jgi:hypothetical protein
MPYNQWLESSILISEKVMRYFTGFFHLGWIINDGQVFSIEKEWRCQAKMVIWTKAGWDEIAWHICGTACISE